jgi:hypothetical protein
MARPARKLRSLRRPLTGAVVLAAGLAVPVGALGASGGVGFGSTTTSSPAPAAVVAGANHRVSVRGDGITLATAASSRTGVKLRFTGSAAGDNGRTLQLQYRPTGSQRPWRRAASARVSRGHFQTVWRAAVGGHLSFRATLARSGRAPVSASAAPATPSLAVTVFHTAKATWYGGSKLWGHRTACGVKLHPSTLGVANRRLRCGTRVTLYYRGSEIVVPVIDRGPYAHNGADWDLTEATARALHTPGLATIGSLS